MLKRIFKQKKTCESVVDPTLRMIMNLIVRKNILHKCIQSVFRSILGTITLIIKQATLNKVNNLSNPYNSWNDNDLILGRKH